MLKYLLIILLIANLVISVITLNKVKNSNEGYMPTSCNDFCFNKCKGSPNFSNCFDNCMENGCIDQRLQTSPYIDCDACLMNCKNQKYRSNCSELCSELCGNKK